MIHLYLSSLPFPKTQTKPAYAVAKLCCKILLKQREPRAFYRPSKTARIPSDRDQFIDNEPKPLSVAWASSISNKILMKSTYNSNYFKWKNINLIPKTKYFNYIILKVHFPTKTYMKIYIMHFYIRLGTHSLLNKILFNKQKRVKVKSFIECIHLHMFANYSINYLSNFFQNANKLPPECFKITHMLEELFKQKFLILFVYGEILFIQMLPANILERKGKIIH